MASKIREIRFSHWLAVAPQSRSLTPYFMAAVIAEAAALMSRRRKTAADSEATMVVAVAVGASAACRRAV
jgi:hypothetical protein